MHVALVGVLFLPQKPYFRGFADSGASTLLCGVPGGQEGAAWPRSAGSRRQRQRFVGSPLQIPSMTSPGVLRGLTLVSLPKLSYFSVPEGVLKRWSKPGVRGEGLDGLSLVA